MAIKKGNKRAQSNLNLKQQEGLKYLKKKYRKSESKILAIGLEMLLEQEQAGLLIPKLYKR
ncbi:hypothetical protein IET41_002491 [Enterococcus faecalis]|uniref:hypothetical protein n=1 Tax=Enterococcus faecalis TaxID=1351 RepID=UPI00032F59A2|nr:hypothetical protein [Enterococcus faecalis]EGO2643361.1 hypothetical protein [Enterococcus faecalis]ELT9180230.1 hypothetical protein [Enterococcus faecalis]EOJ67520.1 hypothetical protein WMY_02756 [Enterococcus faecalis EnGen0337]HAP4280082.1 hypothetical protein [Enterococcus faecalis]